MSLFSIDESFDLNEEDFLQAALDIEKQEEHVIPTSQGTSFEFKNVAHQQVDSDKTTDPALSYAENKVNLPQNSLRPSLQAVMRPRSADASLNPVCHESSRVNLVACHSSNTSSLSSNLDTMGLDLDITFGSAVAFQPIQQSKLPNKPSDHNSNVLQPNSLAAISRNNSDAISSSENKKLVKDNPSDSESVSLFFDMECSVEPPPISKVVSPNGSLLNSPAETNAMHKPESRSGNRRKRKFPGPAGLLPKLRPGTALSDVTLSKPCSPSTPLRPQQQLVSVEVSSSQNSDDQFTDSVWRLMCQEMQPQATVITNKFNMANIPKLASRKHLPQGKVPIVCGLIESINTKNADASIVIKDMSGHMRGTIHRQIIKEYTSSMQPGTGLVLRHVGVFSPNGRNHYLNITPNNLVRVYTPSMQGEPQCTKVADFITDDFIIAEPEPPKARNPCVKPSGRFPDNSNRMMARAGMNGPRPGGIEPNASALSQPAPLISAPKFIRYTSPGFKSGCASTFRSPNPPINNPRSQNKNSGCHYPDSRSSTSQGTPNQTSAASVESNNTESSRLNMNGTSQLRPSSTGSSQFKPQSVGPSQLKPQNTRPSQLNLKPQNTGPSQLRSQNTGSSQFKPQNTGPSQLKPQNTGSSHFKPPNNGPSQIRPHYTRPSQLRPQNTGHSQSKPQNVGLSQLRPQSTGPSQLRPQNVGPLHLMHNNAGPLQSKDVLSNIKNITSTTCSTKPSPTNSGRRFTFRKPNQEGPFSEPHVLAIKTTDTTTNCTSSTVDHLWQDEHLDDLLGGLEDELSTEF